MKNKHADEQRRIVVGVDGFESSKAALRWAIHQAKLTGAVLLAGADAQGAVGRRHRGAKAAAVSAPAIQIVEHGSMITKTLTPFCGVKPFTIMKIEQRTVPVERVHRRPAREPQDRLPGPGSGGGDPPDVPVQVEIRIVAPPGRDEADEGFDHSLAPVFSLAVALIMPNV